MKILADYTNSRLNVVCVLKKLMLHSAFSSSSFEVLLVSLHRTWQSLAESGKSTSAKVQLKYQREKGKVLERGKEKSLSSVHSTSLAHYNKIKEDDGGRKWKKKKTHLDSLRSKHV